MTTYSAPTGSEVGHKKPLTVSLVNKMLNNPIAITEGAAGAPRIAYAALDAWYTTPGGVGTYIFANANTSFLPLGGTVAGSSLFPTAAMYSDTGTSGKMVAGFGVGSALSGTWRCMGTHTAPIAGTGGGSYPSVTLWQRIA